MTGAKLITVVSQYGHYLWTGCPFKDALTEWLVNVGSMAVAAYWPPGSLYQLLDECRVANLPIKMTPLTTVLLQSAPLHRHTIP
jgi:hypothetical protein